MTDLETKAAGTLSTQAAQGLDAMRATIARADEARSDAAHQARGRRRLGRARPPRDHTFGQRAIRLLADQGRQLRELGVEDRRAPAGLRAGRHLAGFAPTRL